MAPIGSDIRMLSHQEVEFFERVRRVRRCTLVGGSVYWGGL